MVNIKNVSRWELASSTPSFEAAIELAKILNVSLDFLGGLETAPPDDALTTLFNSKATSLTSEQKNALKTILEAF